MPNLAPSDLSIKEYESLINMAIQQKTSKIREFLPVYTVKGSARRFNKIEALNEDTSIVAMDTLPGDTNPGVATFDARWLQTSFFKDAKLLGENEIAKIGTVENPLPRIVQAQMAAANRKFDKLAIAGIIGNVMEGADNATTSVAFKEDLATIPVGFTSSGAYAASGLTLDKLLRVGELFGNRSVLGQNVDAQDYSGPEIVMFITASEKVSLLRDEKVSSFFYNEKRPLADANLFDYCGIRFVVVPPSVLPAGSRKLGAKGTGDNSCSYTGTDTAGVRTCVAFVRNSVAFGITEDITTRIDQRIDKEYAWQTFLRFGWGATRLDDLGVLKVDVMIP